MTIQAEITIYATPERVWEMVTDLENAEHHISAIIKTRVIERPESGIVGLKWEETRVMFGKEATETMWISSAVEGECYETTAFNCGCEYNSRVELQDCPEGTRLIMSFRSTPKSLMAKVMSPLGFFFRGMIRSAFQKDLEDIKSKLESD